MIDALHRDKVYRFTIYSKDATSGNMRDGSYQLDIPDFIQDINKYHIAVDECTLYTSSVISGGLSRTYVFETSTNITDSYSTSTKTNSRVLCQMTKTNSADVPANYLKPVTTRTVGIPLVDVNFLRNKEFRVTLKTAADVAHSETTLPAATSGWVMSLLVYPFNQE